MADQSITSTTTTSTSTTSTSTSSTSTSSTSTTTTLGYSFSPRVKGFYPLEDVRY